MKKFFFSAASLLFLSVSVWAQAVEGTVSVGRELQPAAVIQLPYNSSVVSDALADHLSKKGRSKGTDIKGFTTFRNTQASSTGGGNADLYFKVERKSRQEKGSTLVSLLLTAPKDGDSASAAMYHLNMEEAKAYLNELVPAIVAFNLEQVIRDQNAVVNKAESRYRSLTSDGADLEQKKREAEKRISENKMAQESQERELALQKQKLADLVSQRKN